jgi:hypothetical protein
LLHVSHSFSDSAGSADIKLLDFRGVMWVMQIRRHLNRLEISSGPMVAKETA